MVQFHASVFVYRRPAAGGALRRRRGRECCARLRRRGRSTAPGGPRPPAVGSGGVCRGPSSARRARDLCAALWRPTTPTGRPMPADGVESLCEIGHRPRAARHARSRSPQASRKSRRRWPPCGAVCTPGVCCTATQAARRLRRPGASGAAARCGSPPGVARARRAPPAGPRSAAVHRLRGCLSGRPGARCRPGARAAGRFSSPHQALRHVAGCCAALAASGGGGTTAARLRRAVAPRRDRGNTSHCIADGGVYGLVAARIWLRWDGRHRRAQNVAPLLRLRPAPLWPPAHLEADRRRWPWRSPAPPRRSPPSWAETQ